MRNLPTDIATRVANTIQTKDNNSDPKVELTLTRPDIPLRELKYVRGMAFQRAGNLTDVAVAVPSNNPQSQTVFIAYVQNGVAHIVSSPLLMDVRNYDWRDAGIAVPASKIDIAYSGTFKRRGTSDIYEFGTDKYPWFFWVNDGILYARHIGSSQVTQLAGGSGGDVTAVSSVASPMAQFDMFNYGLVCFFIMEGSLWYRQLINNTWYDAVRVMYGPLGPYIDIAAFRTFDYRIGVQARLDNGEVYEVFTQYMNLGNRTSQHFELKNLNAIDGFVIPTERYKKTSDEHFEVNNAVPGVTFYPVVDKKSEDIAFEVSNSQSNYSTLTPITRSSKKIEDAALEYVSASVEYANLTPVSPI